MFTIHLEYIVDEKLKRKSVVLSIEDWYRILDDLEELEKIRACADAMYGMDDELPF